MELEKITLPNKVTFDTNNDGQGSQNNNNGGANNNQSNNKVEGSNTGVDDNKFNETGKENENIGGNQGGTPEDIKRLEEQKKIEEQKKLEEDAKKTEEQKKLEEEQKNKEGKEEENVDNLSDVELSLKDLELELGSELTEEELELVKPILGNNFDQKGVHTDLLLKVGGIVGSRILDDAFGSLPLDVQEYIDFRQNGGAPEDFINLRQQDYNRLEFDDKNKELHRMLIAEEYAVLNNVDRKRAERLAELEMADGKGLERAKESYKKLTEYSKTMQAKQFQVQEAQAKQQIELAQKRQAEIESIINKGMVKLNNHDYIIPEVDRKQLLTEMNNVFLDEKKNAYDANGNSLGHISKVKDLSKAITITQAREISMGSSAKILLSYLMMRPDSLNKLVNKTIEQEKVSKYRKLFRETNNKNVENTNTNKENSNNSKASISHNDIKNANIIETF